MPKEQSHPESFCAKLHPNMSHDEYMRVTAGTQRLVVTSVWADAVSEIQEAYKELDK